MNYNFAIGVEVLRALKDARSQVLVLKIICASYQHHINLTLKKNKGIRPLNTKCSTLTYLTNEVSPNWMSHFELGFMTSFCPIFPICSIVS